MNGVISDVSGISNSSRGSNDAIDDDDMAHVDVGRDDPGGKQSRKLQNNRFRRLNRSYHRTDICFWLV